MAKLRRQLIVCACASISEYYAYVLSSAQLKQDLCAGATEAQSDLACALASLETVARSNAVLDVLQLPQSRVHVCTSLQLLLATAERLAEKPAQA